MSGLKSRAKMRMCCTFASECDPVITTPAGRFVAKTNIFSRPERIDFISRMPIPETMDVREIMASGVVRTGIF